MRKKLLCEANTADLELAGGKKSHACQYVALIELHGKKLCVRHARIEALMLAVESGAAKAIGHMPPNAIRNIWR